MELVGRIDWTNNIKINPLELDFSQFKEPECEHCHTKHYRVITEIIMRDDGTLMQVGTHCVDKLLGYTPRHLGGSERDMLESIYLGGFKGNFYTTREFLYRIINYFEKYGFNAKVSKDEIIKDIYAIKYMDDVRLGKNKDYTLVDKVIKFFEEYEPYNSFTENVKSLVTSENFHIKYFNIIKYAYKIYVEAINYKPEYQSKKTTGNELTIKTILLQEHRKDRYGYDSYCDCYKYLIIDTDNNVYMASTSTERDYKAGDRIKFKRKGSDKPNRYGIIDDGTYKSKKYGIVNKINYLKKIN